jgi:hypothetical protein
VPDMIQILPKATWAVIITQFRNPLHTHTRPLVELDMFVVDCRDERNHARSPESKSGVGHRTRAIESNHHVYSLKYWR